MNKNKKRHISRGKFKRVKQMAVNGMRVNAFTAYSNEVVYASYIVGDFIYWHEREYRFNPMHVVTDKYYRKSLSEALS